MSIELVIITVVVLLNLSFIQYLLYLLIKNRMGSDHTYKLSDFKRADAIVNNASQKQAPIDKKVPLPDPSVFLNKTPTVVSGFGNKTKSVEDNK